MRSVIAAPFIPISFQTHSHRAAQGVIYADILKQSGHCDDIDINIKGELGQKVLVNSNKFKVPVAFTLKSIIGWSLP